MLASDFGLGFTSTKWNLAPLELEDHLPNDQESEVAHDGSTFGKATSNTSIKAAESFRYHGTFVGSEQLAIAAAAVETVPVAADREPTRRTWRC
ncbi:MAG: hypothetical protein ACKV0T_29385 [Planctomycetales bacterium]